MKTAIIYAGGHYGQPHEIIGVNGSAVSAKHVAERLRDIAESLAPNTELTGASDASGPKTG